LMRILGSRAVSIVLIHETLMCSTVYNILSTLKQLPAGL